MRIVVPSIDILRGKAVRLVQGREGTETIFGDPLELATKYNSLSFGILHVVDLDAAFGGQKQFAILNEMLKVCKRMKIQWAGGIRTYDLAKEAFDAGADRVVFGSSIFQSKEEVLNCTESFGPERVWGALDFAGNPRLARIKGWKEATPIGLMDAIRSAEECKVGGIILSSVDADGMGMGPDLSLISDVEKSFREPVWLSGGMRGVADAYAAFELGAQGVIFGRALYDNKTDLEELLRLQEE